MLSTEVIPGIHQIKSSFIEELGFIASYIVVSGGKALVVDPGTAGEHVRGVLKTLKNLGLSHRSDVESILCTHGHPDHIGGAAFLRKATGAPLLIHAEDAEMLQNPPLFLKKRLGLGMTRRFVSRFQRGIMRINYGGIEPDGLLKHGDKIQVGDCTLKVTYTGGHSIGHCVFHDEERKALFSGDEINNFANNPRKFYFDLSGSVARKIVAIDKMMSAEINYLFPTHDTPHLFTDAKLQFKEIRDGLAQFQENLLRHLSARGDADIEQLVYDIQQVQSVPLPTTVDELLLATMHVCLKGLEEAGLVQANEKGVWSLV